MIWQKYDNAVLESVVDSVTKKVLISDTTLRSFILPQFCKMTPRLLQIRECDIFIIPKYMNIGLNTSIKNIASYLQQTSIGRHTWNSSCSTTSDVNYK